VTSTVPGAPSVASYRGTPTGAVVLGALTPTGAAYGAATAAEDDFLNQVLAAATEAGLVEGTVDDEPPGGSLGLTAGTLATAIPTAGFEAFDPATPIRLRTHATVASTYLATPGGPGHGDLIAPNVEVSFEVDTSYGSVRILRAAYDVTRTVVLGVASDGTLDVSVVALADGLSVLQAWPGSLVAFLPGGLLVAEQVLPQPVTVIDSIPVPDLIDSHLALSPEETSLAGPALDHLATYGTLVVTP
jgi:hypothetical protein